MTDVILQSRWKPSIHHCFLFFLSAKHRGQNHFPLGFVVRPTHPKWNHSMGHCNMKQVAHEWLVIVIILVYRECSSLKWQWTFDTQHTKLKLDLVIIQQIDNKTTHVWIITANHFTIRHLMAEAVGGLVWIYRHIQNIWRVCDGQRYCQRGQDRSHTLLISSVTQKRF